MHPLRAICLELGFFTRQHARDAGMDERAIDAESRSRRWLRMRRGYYTFPDIWAASSPEERHLLRCRAVLDSLGDAVALSHVSGCLAAGIDVWGVSLDRVHVTRLDGGAGRIDRDVVHHEGFVARDDVGTIDGLRVLTPVRCALEAGSLASSEAALVLLNSALYQGLCSPDDVDSQFDVMAHWPRVRHLHVPVRMASGRAESVGESRSLWMFWTQGIPAPVLQYEVYDGRRLVGRTDFGWPTRSGLGEFDGQVKYGRRLALGQDPSAVVFAEKRREDDLREVTGYWMFRLAWADLDRPDPTAARLRRFLSRVS